MPAFGFLIVLLAATMVVFLLRRGGNTTSGIPIHADSVVVIDARSGTIRDDIAVPVGSVPAPLLVGEGALWTYNESRQTLIRISPNTRHAAERGIGVAPTDLAVGAGYEWIADGVDNKLFQLQWGTGLGASPVRLPRSTYQPVAGMNLRPSESGQVTVHGRDVWATSQGTGWPQTVVAINAATLTPLHTFHVSVLTRQIGDVESGPAGVWMENRIEGANSGKAALVALTPTLGHPNYVSQGNYLQQGLAVTQTAVWFAGGTSRVVAKLDPSTDSWVPVVTPRPVTAIAAGPAGVWAATSDPGIAHQLDSDAERVIRTVRVGRYVTGIAVGKSRVWVLVQHAPVTA